MAGFLRRYGTFPSVEQIQQIEGVVIVDLPPPGSIQGVSSGVTCLIGEFVDMTYAGVVDTTGLFVRKPTPVEIVSATDLINKLGGFDSTIGQFGGAMGNGFVELRNKRFARLVVVPIDMVAGTMRVFRTLPLNASATNALPVTTLQAGLVSAGREFKDPTNRVRLASRSTFSDTPALRTGTNGITNVVSVDSFDSASGAFTVADVGRILVIGHAGTVATDRGTFRIKTIVSLTRVLVENMDGTATAFVGAAAQPWRVHDGAVADTGGTNALSVAGSYTALARTLDAIVIAGDILTPTIVPASTDNLAGLGAIVHPANPLSAVIGSYPVNSATLQTAYDAAFDSLLTEDPPARDVSILWAARKARGIANKGKTHVLVASSQGIGRRFVSSPGLLASTSTELVALGEASGAAADTAFGVGSADAAGRDERVIYDWPGLLTFVPEASNISIATSDGKTTTDGVLDVTSDGWMCAVMSNLVPERNPGQAGPPVPEVLSPVLGLQRGISGLGIADYTLFRQAGIAAPRIDRTVGPIFQSGITTSLESGRKNINRRRMADFIEDSIARRLVQFAKLPLTPAFKDAVVVEANAFMVELLSPDNPPAQRISDFQIDDVSGNTPELEAKGIFVIIVRVRTLATADFVVIQAEVGEGVVITTSL